jgi:DNA repair photolyase
MKGKISGARAGNGVRGAQSNPSGRFERLQIVDNPDGEPDGQDGEPPAQRRTEFFVDHSRSVLNRTDSPDVGFTHSVNPYRGCEHGCAYCYARPTHEYLGLSPGLDFESRILAKLDAPDLLRAALLKPSWQPDPVNLSGVTDCYQPLERKLRLTRGCLEVLAEFRNPFTIITKNHGVTRDLDVIAPMARLGAAVVLLSVTTLDPELSARMEPRASRPSFRLEAIRTLTAAGIPVGVMTAPVIPGLTDHELPGILSACAEAGARWASFVPLRLPGAVLGVFTEWLARHYPERESRVISRIREVRGGKLNDARFGSRMRGEGAYAEQIRAVHELWCRKLGLNREEMQLSTAHFRRPPQPGSQLELAL